MLAHIEAVAKHPALNGIADVEYKTETRFEVPAALKHDVQLAPKLICVTVPLPDNAELVTAIGVYPPVWFATPPPIIELLRELKLPRPPSTLLFATPPI